MASVEEAAATSYDWDQIAHTYRNLESVFRDNGLDAPADYYRSLERRAEGLSAKATGSLSGYLSYTEMLSYRIIFEIGVTRVMTLMVVVYGFSTLWYISAGLEDPFYYSIVVFTTSPSAAQAPTAIILVDRDIDRFLVE